MLPSRLSMRHCSLLVLVLLLLLVLPLLLLLLLLRTMYHSLICEDA